jgi:hypothetical protein
MHSFKPRRGTSTRNGSYYDGNAVLGTGVDQLSYFGVSVFWRAAAHEWRFVDHNKRLQLGAYEEALRVYLLDKRTFPSDAALDICVSESSKPLGFMNAPITRQTLPFHIYTFNIPGIAFVLSFGVAIFTDAVETCAIRSAKRTICLNALTDHVALRDAGFLKAMHDQPTPKGRSKKLHERTTHEAARFLRATAGS